jgi:DNA polymerase III alpha subunit
MGEETLPKPEDKDVDEIIEQICRKGMRKRGLVGKKEYEDRLAHELELIKRKKFSVYFVILWDALRWCRTQNIAIGHGRGSACGSLVCYVMEITEVDPIEYKLLFWRFLSEDREGYPDVDVDISDTGRIKLKRYLEQKYGPDKVASVTTFIYYSAKSAIKAACRVLAVPYKEANEVVAGYDNMTMADFRRAHFKEFHEKYPGVYKLAKALEGRLSSVGYHAAATVITNQPIADLTSLESRKLEGEDSRQPVISLPKDDAEELGFVKYDFLSLKNLTVVSDTVELIKKNHGKIIDTKKIPLDDKLVMGMLSEGKTLGVFQAEQPASTRVIQEMGINSFMDLVASNALVRPGAWKAMGEEFLARKKGHKKVTYPITESEEFLAETWGLALFQEQTLLVCTQIAGLSEKDADKIRKLTAHKEDKALLEPFKDKFIEGAANRVSQKQAEKMWQDIEYTAEYSFNKCLTGDTSVEVMWIDENDDQRFDLWDIRDLYTFKGEVYVKGPKTISGPRVGEDAWHRVVKVHDNGIQDVYRIAVDTNTYIDSTANHKHRLSKSWKEARRIHQGDQIWTSEGKKKVWKRDWVGQAQTYDVELADEPHAFYANGFLTHNSHSVAYSKLSMITAWLKYYYPAEFMASLLANEKDGASISDYLTECNRLGLDVKTPDVNKSELGYSTKDNVIYMGLSNVKFISDKLAQRLINLRPFDSYEDLRAKIMEKGSGLNSRVIDSLNKIGAAEFPDNPVDHEACKENYYEYLGIASFDDGQITSRMRERITNLEDYKEKTDGIVLGIVKDIVVKGWIRVDIADSTGKLGIFVGEGHGLEKGHKYIFALAKGNYVGSIDLSEFKPGHPIVRYLRGDMNDGTWFVAAKSRTTKNGQTMGTLLYSYKGRLNSCTIFSDMMMVAKRFRPGDKIRIKVNSSPKWGDSLAGIIKDTRGESD